MMKLHFRRSLLFLLCLCMIFPLLTVPALGTEADGEEKQEAQNISRAKYITECVGFPSYGYFFDGKTLYGGKSTGNGYFTVKHADGVGSIYIIFQHEFGPYTVTNNDSGETVTVGQGYYLHEYLDMEELFGSCPNSVTVKFPGKVAYINELYLFTPGEVPEFVQKWEAPADGETDLVLFSTHGDDEQLFFLGALPYYGAELGYQVQVVYLTNHRNNSSIRIHEMLNGLWAVGVKAYPVFGEYDDFRTGDMESAYRNFKKLGWEREEMLGFVVEQMRRFKPKVVLAHDFNGEYKHGQHMVYADLVASALEISNDPTYYRETADRYGIWDVPKAYFHLYEENPIVMDWDQPLESFGGETAFEVSIYRGFKCHETQLKDFTWYYRGCEKAIEIEKYNPCYYGLYRTTVGLDEEKNDFFEHLTSHAQDKILEEERKQQLERDRLEAERKEQERQEREEQKQTEPTDNKNSAAQQALDAQQQRAKEARIRKNRIMLLIAAVITAVLVPVCVIVIHRHSKKRSRKNKKKK